MKNKTIWIIIGAILLLVILNSNLKKTSGIGCIESDKGDISIKGICSDGDVYTDICRIDGGKTLIEAECSSIGKCISQTVICDNVCSLGECKA